MVGHDNDGSLPSSSGSRRMDVKAASTPDESDEEWVDKEPWCRKMRRPQHVDKEELWQRKMQDHWDTCKQINDEEL